MLASQDGPDVWLIPNDWLPKHKDKLSPVPEGFLAKQNNLVPAPKRGIFGPKASPAPSNQTVATELFAPVTLTENLTESTLFAVPLSVDTLGLFANQALLQEKNLPGPPATWEEVIAAVETLTERSGLTVNRPAIGLGTSNNISRATDILAALMIQNHTPLVSDDRSTALLNQSITKATGEPIQPGLAALDFYTSFASPTKETYTWNSSFPNDFELFAAGQLPLMIDHSYRIQDLTQKVPTLPFATSHLPQIAGEESPTTLASALVLGVPSVSKNPTEAWNFISFLTNAENSLAYARATSRPPARMELLRNPTFDPRLTPFLKQVPFATFWYRNEINKTSSVFASAIDAVLAGQPLSEVIDKLTKQVTHILRSEPYE